MTEGFDKKNIGKAQIERHLSSAVTALTPNVLDFIDLTQKQDPVQHLSKIRKMHRQLRAVSMLAAACLCVLVLGGGTYTYRNQKVDSIIGIDVNPSIEMTVNRKNRVLEAKALNEDANLILDDMEFKNVDLNIAVNAVIGSMVKHGYLDDLDNAILVTVSNDSISKATSLRELVVGDIENSLIENQVQAVVYDQQVIENDEIKQLALEYGISYGKAYFLKELIGQNATLTMNDMDALAPLTMEEIAKEITERSYALDEKTRQLETVPESTTMTTSAATTAPETVLAETTTVQETTTAPPSTATAPEPTTQPTTAETVPETTQEVVVAGKVKIDNVDHERGITTVTFDSKVKWKNATVSVMDEYGNAYPSVVAETDSHGCEIHTTNLEQGVSYTFVLGGVYSSSSSKATTVTGTFDTPFIAVDDEEETELVTQPEPETTLPESTPAETLPKEPETTIALPIESETPVETATPPATTASQPETAASKEELPLA